MTLVLKKKKKKKKSSAESYRVKNINSSFNPHWHCIMCICMLACITFKKLSY